MCCFTSVLGLFCRPHSIHAVADKVPNLLPYVLMAYQQRLPPVIQRVDGSHEFLWSKAGVRYGDRIAGVM